MTWGHPPPNTPAHTRMIRTVDGPQNTKHAAGVLGLAAAFQAVRLHRSRVAVALEEPTIHRGRFSNTSLPTATGEVMSNTPGATCTRTPMDGLP